MDRDTGIRRTRGLTYGLAGASLAGIVAVGAFAQHATTTSSSTGTSTTTGSTSTSNGTSGDDTTYPTLTDGSDGHGAATSGGS